MTTHPTTTWPVGEWIDAPAERRQDKKTGVTFDVLTGGCGNNTHIYFNRANFTCDGKQVIFRSDRTGSWQIYDADTGIQPHDGIVSDMQAQRRQQEVVV